MATATGTQASAFQEKADGDHISLINISETLVGALVKSSSQRLAEIIVALRRIL